MSNYALRNFSGGEISPSLYARTDLVKYATSAKTVRNFIVRRQGGLDSRMGTELVGLAPPSGVARLLPFIFNADQTYVLEFSEALLRFIRDGAYVGAPYSIVTPYAANELAALQISQSADVVTIVHANHPPYELRRLAETNWTLTPITFAPTLAAPVNLQATPVTPSVAIAYWCVTALSSTGDESYASTEVIGTSGVLPVSKTLTWDAVSGAVGYNIYKRYNSGGFGWIGTTADASYFDIGQTPDFTRQPPVARTLFAAVGDYPAAVGAFQQRMLYAGADNTPETVYTSRSGNVNNFTVSIPTQDDDAITFTLVGRRVNAIRHIVDAGALLLFTSGGEWLIGGDAAGVLRPTDINALNFSQHGASLLPPIQIDSRVLYVQARLSIVRDIARDPYRGYQGNDLTLFSTHLFERHTLADWAFQESASIIWCVRDDGVLLGLTDVAEQEVLGWHRHDTDGLVENVCVVPEGTDDALYLVVNRDGVRMVERMASRSYADVQDAITVDSALTYDGRNTDATKTMTLSGGSTWEYDEELTCTCSAAEFVATDVGNGVYFTAYDGTQLRFIIGTYVSATAVRGFAAHTVPADLRSAATASWARAVDEVTGLSHLEGKAVSVFADGYVVANPNNPAVTVSCVVSGGAITLDRPYAYIHVGLPYVCDLKTLGLDTPSGPSLRDKRLLINKVVLEVEASRGLFAGADEPDDDGTDGLFEIPLRDTVTFGEPIEETSGAVKVNIDNSWDQEHTGGVFIRQVDPVPCRILAVIPTGFIPPAS